MVKIIVKLLTLLTFVVSSSALALSSVSASIDANPVMSNESIVLTVVANDSVERDALDTSPLLTDFMIARSEVSSQTSIVNFNTSKTTRWQIVLIPRKKGNLTIPSLSINGYQSQAINVEVIEPGSKGSPVQQDIFISAELSSHDVYVQQLITLTVKLHVGVQLQRGSLTEPSLPGATIEQIDKDQESNGIVNGKRYRIIERTYAITPEKSGDLTLDTPMFSGDIMVQSQRRSGFLSFGETKPVNVLGEQLALKVRPIPDRFPVDANNSWLPSELLTLHQEWQPQPSEFFVGEPITRTITLTAAGLGKAQLPQLVMNAPAGLKIYPDQAELHSSFTKERLISQKRQNFALVASRAGDYELPKMTIAWWNTVTNQYQQAILPAQTIKVKANPNAEQVATATNTPAAIENSTGRISESNSALAAKPIIIEKSSNLQWLFLILWLLTAFAWMSHVWYLKRASKPSKQTVKSANNHYLELMAACKKNQAEQALKLILPWLNTLSQQQDNIEITTLSDAMTQVNNQLFTCAIEEIQQHLYGKKTSNDSWLGENLLKAIQQVNNSGIQCEHNTGFTLNPN
ncbi:BatD family protein [Colwellia sp. KU-HH00111]|uniref:BatD family protein n=1 Tax=Colwellia sp. KU-HH00111 TaxID=3127652 RepID=UPI00310BB412